MDALHNLAIGFSVSLTPGNILYCFIGVLLGQIVGILPGLGASGTVALLLPFTFYLNDVSAIIMVAGIYYGTMYGGSITSILLHIPGEAASVVTCLDGFEMAKNGRAGAALGISAFGSFFAGTMGVIGLVLLAPILAEFGLLFGPPEYFALAFMGLMLVTQLTGGSKVKAIIMAATGLLLSTIGLDPISSAERFSYGTLTLLTGLDLVPIAMGLFGISEVFSMLGESGLLEKVKPPKGLLKLLPSRDEWRRSAGPIARGSILGFLIGIIPGGNATLSTFVSYTAEKKLSRRAEMFGKGAIEGVAGPESANNASSQGAFVPLLTLGIPTNAIMALTLGAFMIHGVQPGPMLLVQRPDMFWGVVSSMYVGNVLLLILNLPLIGLFTKITNVPGKIMAPFIAVICMIGAYALANDVMQIFTMIVFGFAGYLLKKYGYESAPLILGFILGRLFEISLRQSLIISDGSLAIFFTQPIAAGLLCIAGAILFLSPALRLLKKRSAFSVQKTAGPGKEPPR